MPTYNTPGVYIEEISTLPASVAPVATAIPAFIGYTKLTADEDGVDLKFKPQRITSMLEYVELFGGAKNDAIAVSIVDTYNVDDDLLTREYSATATASDYILYHSLSLYFANGGGPCYIVSVGSDSDPLEVGDGSMSSIAGGLTGGILAIEKVDEPTLILFPEASKFTNQSDYGSVVVAALTSCAKVQDRFTIADFNGDITDNADVLNYRSELGMNNLKYGASYGPELKTTLNYGYDNATVTVTHTNSGGTAPPAPAFNAVDIDTINTTNPSVYRSIIAEIGKVYVDLPASPAVAGAYARVDADRGVWKAPANVGLNSVLAPTVMVTNEMQDNLNVDPSTGKSINAIRAFSGKGILIWGARTLAGNDNEWRYVPVRRLYIFVEESIKKATEFVVFEPNSKLTWVRTKAMIENFLTGLWRDGALAGAKPEQAFFVRVGLGETMTAQDILEGRMNVEIGLAAVRPAEFIILKFSHKLQES
ncbi:phage tail sheath family protein [Aquimarina sp. BL5]|uniref:phage tail sheath family protein n=1 Tax=Aquimarina sp. BL5 TaxID=1714860 RepID=UPI000E47E66B|nr:phage tail sheath C-terminal domain-containing protein [Aquimarina sp. BL5]AXT53600.1 phage tail sheath family protein [Aquimarina sp. BL5]RKN03871.1 phage tail sheath family protein [Aquimarina sp. BL5]